MRRQHNVLLRLQPRFSYKGGFTLVELLVALFISIVIAAVVLADFGTFTSETAFKNKALDVALAIRDAQGYGLSGKQASSSLEDVRYGVYFDQNTYRDGADSRFYVFADTNKNDTYDSGEEIDTIELKQLDGYVIDDVCLVDADLYWGTYFISGGNNRCADSFIPSVNFRVTLLFNRSGVAPLIIGRVSSWLTYKNIKAVDVVLERVSDGATTTVSVNNVGSIVID